MPLTVIQMSNSIQPESWSDFFGIWLFYILSFGLIFHLAFFICGCLLTVLICAISKQMFALRPRIVRFGLFCLILLITSGGFNALWNCAVWGNLYITYGADIEDDFTPFIPINQTAINAENGKLLSVTIYQLQLVWLIFAGFAWGVAFFCYRFISRTPKNEAPNAG